jgi:hypothetical protein
LIVDRLKVTHMTLLAQTASFDLQTVIATLAPFRPFLELVGVIVISALIGFLTARALYRGKAVTRTEVLRFEQAKWRRRLSQSRTETRSVVNERERIQRRSRKPLRASAPAPTDAPASRG